MLGSFHGFLIQRDTLKKLPASLLVPGCMPLVVYLYLLLLIATQLLHGKASCAFVSVHIGMFRSANIGYLCQFSHGFHGASLNAHVNSSYNSRHAQMRFSVLLGITHWICCVPLFFFFFTNFWILLFSWLTMVCIWTAKLYLVSLMELVWMYASTIAVHCCSACACRCLHLPFEYSAATKLSTD